MATANKNPQAAKAAASKSVAATAGQPAPGMRQMLQVIAKRDGFVQPGDHVVITAGVPFGTPGRTNVLRIAQINDGAK